MKLMTLIAIFLTLVLSTALAHHSYSAAYGAGELLALEGVVTEIRYENPHVEVVFEVTSEDGAIKAWTLDGPSPNRMARQGVRRDALELGMTINLTGWPADDGSAWVAGHVLTLPNGTAVTLRERP